MRARERFCSGGILMRKPRLKAPPEQPFGFYHCYSRVVNHAFVLLDPERDKFVELMRRYEAFCGVHIQTYSIMSNHFHILLQVPARPQISLSDEELLERCALLYDTKELKKIRRQLTLRKDRVKDWNQFREKYLCRMWDVSQFMKSLKQTFTQWFNNSRPKGRKGTLWEERYGSVLVEGTAEALATMAAYIDLNPVRAGMVDDPKDYRWCGYGAAAAGDERAKAGLDRLSPPGTNASMNWYRMLLFAEGMQEGLSTPETPIRRGLSPEQARQVWAEGGEIGLFDALRCRVRYFAKGAVLGSREFANHIFARNRSHFGSRRRDGARPLPGIDTSALGGLYGLKIFRPRRLE